MGGWSNSYRSSLFRVGPHISSMSWYLFSLTRLSSNEVDLNSQQPG
jgi:hypothetical protein